VRAKVHLMRARQDGVSPSKKGRLIRSFRTYLELAGRYAAPAQGALIITHGLSGSGKTTVTQSLMERIGAIRIRSDVERKRLHGMVALTRSRSAPGAGIYTRAATAATYRRLGSLARIVADSGFPVIVDATFLRRAEREAFRAIADASSAPFAILDFRVPLATLRKRVALRSAQRNDASEADLAILERQIATCEPFTPAEMEATVKIDGTRSGRKNLLHRLRRITVNI
jgi:predicted kinase